MVKWVIFLASFYVFCYGDLPYIYTDLLPTVEEMELSTKNFGELAEAKLALFVNASEEKRYNEAYEAWSSLCDSFFYLQIIYYQTISLTSNMILKGYAGSNLLELHGLFRKYLRDNIILSVFEKNAFDAALLSPFQRDLTLKVLEGSQSSNMASLEKLKKYERNNFIYQEVQHDRKSIVGNRLKVLTANILCFPGELTYFFGGLPPWKQRIDQIIEKIMSTKADVICLQEVWDKEVACVLIEKLKNKYSYFIYDAGNQYGTVNPEEIGFNSGLFIGSKVPLDAINFTPFEHIKPKNGGVKRGAIRLEFSAGNTQWTLVATHLQHGIGEDEEEIRKHQFKQCTKLLGQDKGFILGDFNINAFSEEFRSSELVKDFRIHYLDHKVAVTKATATATDYFNDLTHTEPAGRKKIVPTYELLDYCVMRNDIKSMKVISQERVPFFSIENSNGSISDHHGILTVWKVL